MGVWVDGYTSDDFEAMSPREKQEIMQATDMMRMFRIKTVSILVSLLVFWTVVIATLQIFDPLILLLVFVSLAFGPLTGLNREHLDTDTPWQDFFIKGNYWLLRGGVYFYRGQGIADEHLIQTVEHNHVRVTDRLVLLKHQSDAVALRLAI